MLRPKHLFGICIASLFTRRTVRRCSTRRPDVRRRTEARDALVESLERRILLSGAGLGPGNILVSGEIAGTNWLFEYTPDGELVRSFEVPDASFDSSATERIRDIVVGPDGLIRIFNGTFAPYVTTLAPFAGTFEHRRPADWSIVNATGYGKIAILGDYIFVHDMATAGSPDKGLVRFDATDFSATRFGESHEFLYVTAGFDGLVYGRDATGLMHVFNPITLEKLRTFMVPFGHGAAVAANGEVFTAATDRIFHYDGQGNLLKTLSTGASNLVDIDLHPDGRLVASGHFGEVFLTDTTLEGVTSSFSIAANPAFVAFTDALTAETRRQSPSMPSTRRTRTRALRGSSPRSMPTTIPWSTGSSPARNTAVSNAGRAARLPTRRTPTSTARTCSRSRRSTASPRQHGDGDGRGLARG